MAVWSEVRVKDLTPDLRVDADYYQPEYIKMAAQLKAAGAQPWAQLDGDFIVGPFGSAFLVENFVDASPYRYLRGRDVKPFFLLDDQNCFISSHHFQALRKYQVLPGDLLISVVGTLGNVAVVTDDIGEAVYSCKSTLFRSREIDAYYLCAYLNSSVGKSFLERLERGHVQTGLNLYDLRSLPILRLGDIREQQLGDLLRTAYGKKTHAKSLYRQAESLLLQSLGVQDLELSPDLFYERCYRDVAEARRIDPDYFQPMYYRLQGAIESSGYPLASLSDLIEPVRNGYDFREFVEEGTPYIRVGDIRQGVIDFESAARVDIKTGEVKKNVQLHAGDVLFSRKGSFGNAAVVREDQTDAIISSEIMLLRLQGNSVNPDFLAAYLNSPLGFNQVERRVHGSAFYSISQPDLATLQVIRAPSVLQEEIARTVQASLAARDHSLRLLEEAKHAVEALILGENSA